MMNVEGRVGVGSAWRGSAQPQVSKYGTRDFKVIDVFTRRNFRFHTRISSG